MLAARNGRADVARRRPSFPWRLGPIPATPTVDSRLRGNAGYARGPLRVNDAWITIPLAEGYTEARNDPNRA